MASGDMGVQRGTLWGDYDSESSGHCIHTWVVDEQDVYKTQEGGIQWKAWQ